MVYGPESGYMIGCDSDYCPIEWFHFDCVGITEAPSGKWICAECKAGEYPLHDHCSRIISAFQCIVMPSGVNVIYQFAIQCTSNSHWFNVY